MKTLVLRTTMLSVLTLGLLALAKPVKASAFGCVYGAYCETKTTSPGSCGGADACWCYGADGSESYDGIDCAFLYRGGHK